MKKIYIKENKLNLLKEGNSPDCVFIDDEALTYFDKDAHAFIVMNSKDGFKIAIGEEGSTHSSIINEIAANYMGFRTYDDFKEYIHENDEYYDDLYGELEMHIDDICNNSLYDGRYWVNKEIITFWYKTPSTEKLDLILNEICEKLGIDASNVRIVVGNHIIPYEEYNYWDDIDNDKFKSKDSKSDKELKAIHLMNQQDKKDALKDFRQNRGEIQGKKLGKMPMAQYHSLIYQEEKNSNKKLLKEYYSSPDTICIDGKVMTYDDYNVYPFIVVDGDLFIGDEGTTHNDVGLQYVINYFNFDGFSDYIERRDAKVIQFKADIGKGINDDTIKCGRYWADENVLSIWHPEKLKEGELEFIVQELKYHFDINEMDLGFVYEGDIIPYTNFVQDDDYEENEKESEMRAIHLMNQQDKRDALKDFRQNRGEIQGQKLGKIPMAQYHNMIYQEGKDINTILENFELEVEPDEIDLSSFEIEKSLNREIWDENNELNSRIRLKLLDIADDFFNSLEVNFVKPIDIVLTGSLCNFNWSEFSDIDLHIIVNFDEISEKTEFVKEYFDAKKNEWNNEHKDLKIYDFPIELYVQNSNEYGISNGMYSLESNEWIKEPNINDLEPLDKVSSQKIKRIASNIMTKIDDYFDYFAECSDNHKLELLNNEIDNLLYKLKVYRQKGLEKYGESGTPNIVYKVLRRTKYLEDLWELRTQIYDKLNSIN